MKNPLGWRRVIFQSGALDAGTVYRVVLSQDVYIVERRVGIDAMGEERWVEVTRVHESDLKGELTVDAAFLVHVFAVLSRVEKAEAFARQREAEP